MLYDWQKFLSLYRNARLERFPWSFEGHKAEPRSQGKKPTRTVHCLTKRWGYPGERWTSLGPNVHDSYPVFWVPNMMQSSPGGSPITLSFIVRMLSSVFNDLFLYSFIWFISFIWSTCSFIFLSFIWYTTLLRSLCLLCTAFVHLRSCNSARAEIKPMSGGLGKRISGLAKNPTIRLQNITRCQNRSQAAHLFALFFVCWQF